MPPYKILSQQQNVYFQNLNGLDKATMNLKQLEMRINSLSL